MKFLPLRSGFLLLLLTGWASAAVQLEEVASFPKQQVTGVAVSLKGRVFVNFPYWADEHGPSVVELMPDHTARVYPDAAWNQNGGRAENRFVCVQSEFVDDTDTLWVLDPASPKMAGTVKNGPKLVKIDLTSNQVSEVFLFSEEIAPEHSYLNDLRVDTKQQVVYMTESGLGAIIVLDLKTKKARRLLANHYSTQAEGGTDLVVDGIRLEDPKTLQAPAMHADGIALDLTQGWLYYRPLTGHCIYKVKTADLLDEKLSEAELGQRVVKAGESAATDGMIADKAGRIYNAAFEKNAVVRLDPATGQLDTIIADERLQWPDTMSWGPDGALYVTASQIHRMPKYNQGQSKQLGAFKVFKITGLNAEAGRNGAP